MNVETPNLITALCALLGLFAAGCHHTVPLNQFDSTNGLTFVLPGIEGESFVNRNITDGLRRGGVGGEIRVFDWTSGNPIRSLEHLTDKQRVLEQACIFAGSIESVQRQTPGIPISIVAHSGGAGVALGALELLPPHPQIASVVLIAPAISRTYLVENVAPKTRLGIWSFNSPLDVQLTAGTSLLGSVDRRYGPAAGSYGFKSNAPKLFQFGYDPRMLSDFHHGGHLGATNPLFVKKWIAPIVDRSHRIGN